MIEPRMGPLDPPTDIWFCKACGRTARAILGHDRVNYCYGCGVQGALEETKESDPKAVLFGQGGWYPAPWETQEVEWPGDIRFDPWTGERIESPGGPCMEDWQRREAGLASIEKAKPIGKGPKKKAQKKAKKPGPKPKPKE